MIKNLERVEQYLIEKGFVVQAMAEHVWLKQYDKIDCCVDLNEDSLKIEWYPHGDYSKKSTDLEDQSGLKELKTVLQNISKSNHLPPILSNDSPKVDDEATESLEPTPDDSVPPTNQQEKDSTLSMEDAEVLDKEQSSAEGVESLVGKSKIPKPSFVKDVDRVHKDVYCGQCNKLLAQCICDKEKTSSSVPSESMSPAQPSGGVPAVRGKQEIVNKTDEQLDRMMNDAKAKRWLEGRGESYKVHGQERPDAASIQRVSNIKGVCTEIISAVQTKDYAEAVVRAQVGGIFVDAVVHHDFENYRRILVLEMINKHPDVLDCWNGDVPVMKPGATIKDKSGNVKDAQYTIMHTFFSFIQFALRDATTKAEAAAQAKILNQDWQEDEDIKSEQFERDLVQQGK